jgi:hypothetical protein
MLVLKFIAWRPTLITEQAWVAWLSDCTMKMSLQLSKLFKVVFMQVK